MENANIVDNLGKVFRLYQKVDQYEKVESWIGNFLENESESRYARFPKLFSDIYFVKAKTLKKNSET